MPAASIRSIRGARRVLGERAWPSLAALPEAPEHVYIVTPTEAAVAAVEECGRLGVKVATVLADGFAEAGHAGLARERRLRETCASTGIRLVGPSSLGIVDLRTKSMMTANAAFDEPELPVGRIFAASHSGSMIGALLTRGKARGIGFAGLVSVGNEVDLSLGDICEATLDDPGIDSYMLFLETMRHGAALRRFALAAAARGKPMLAYKLGRSAAARELAVSHTGALAGEDDVADVFLAECGIARVDTLDGLIEGLPLLTRMPLAAPGLRRRNVGVVTTTAGGATMVVDPLASRGVPSSRRARRPWRGSPPPASRSSRRGWSTSPLPARSTHNEDRARHFAVRAGIRPRARGRRLVGAGAAGEDRAADHRQRGRGQAAGGVPRARGAGGAGGAEPRRRAEFPHARSLRRRHRRGACAACSAAGDGTRARHRPRAADACSTSSRPARCSTGSASRGRHRSRSTPASPTRRCCPFAIRSRSRFSPPRSRTRPMSAASCSESPTAKALLAAVRKHPRERRRTNARGARVDRVLVQPMMSGPRRGSGRLSRRPRRRAAGHGGGRRRACRDRARPQPAPGAGRSRHRAAR